MANIHYFQRYSQPENVATNNTLLLFSRFYQEKPIYLQKLLHALIEFDVTIGITIRQQEGGPKGIPDGFIRQSSFEIIIETKTSDWFYPDQFERHITAFSSSEGSNKILLAIVDEISNERRDSLSKELNQKFAGKFKILTFKQIADEALSVASGNSLLEEISQEFEEYCQASGLYPKSRSRMKVFAAGETLDENIKYSMYYRNDGTKHMFDGYQFIGMYHNKAIGAIGKVRGYIDAYVMEGDPRSGDAKWYTEAIGDLKNAADASELMARARSMSLDSPYDIARIPHRFVVVDAFRFTYMPKSSPGGIRGPRAFELLDIDGITNAAIDSPDSTELANQLNGKSWA